MRRGPPPNTLAQRCCDLAPRRFDTSRGHAATLPRQCWSASLAVRRVIGSYRAARGIVVKSRKIQVRKKTRKIVCHHFLSFLIRPPPPPGSSRYFWPDIRPHTCVTQRARDRIVEKCDSRDSSFIRDPVEIKNRKFLSRFALVQYRAEISQKL